MLADEYPDFGARGPRSIGGSPVHLHLYVPDADAVVARAVAAGATVVRPLEDQFYGDRAGTIEDPFGHVWIVSTKAEGARKPEPFLVTDNKESDGTFSPEQRAIYDVVFAAQNETIPLMRPGGKMIDVKERIVVNVVFEQEGSTVVVAA
jgi:hypothetical protein